MHNNDKYDGHCYVKVDLYFTAAGLFTISDEKEIEKMMNDLRERLNKEKKTA